MTKKKGKGIWLSPAKPDDPIYKEGLTIFTPLSARGSTPSARPRKTGKSTFKGFAKLGERGLSGGAIITGANLRRPPEKKSPTAKLKPKADK